MKIEVVDVRAVGGETLIKAFADVKFGDEIIVKGFQVYQGKRGLFIVWPRKAGKDGRWFDIITVLSESFKLEMETKIMELYDKECCHVC